MATSGSFHTSGYKGRYLRFEWTQKSQSIADNTTTIHWELKGAGGLSTDWYYTGNVKLWIYGSLVYQSTENFKLYHQTVASGDIVISHNADGNKSFSASCEAGIYNWGDPTCTGSGSWALTQIPRKAVLTGAPSFTDIDSPSITYGNPAGEAASVQAHISWDGGSIPYRRISNTATTYTFNLTEGERNLLRKACQAPSITVAFTIYTNMGGHEYYDSLHRSFSVVDADPEVSLSVQVEDDVSKRVTGNNHTIVRGVSSVGGYLTYNPKKMASIVESGMSAGYGWKKDNPITFVNVSNPNFSGFALDSRGNRTEVSRNLDMIPYVPVTCVFSLIGTMDEHSNAAIHLDVSGQYFNGSFGAQQNGLYVFYRIKKADGQYTDRVRIDPTISGNSYTAAVDIPVDDYTAVYTVQLYSGDQIGSGWSEEQNISIRPIFEVYENSVFFNVPIYVQNRGIGHTVISSGRDGPWAWRKYSDGTADLTLSMDVAIAPYNTDTVLGHSFVTVSPPPPFPVLEYLGIGSSCRAGNGFSVVEGTWVESNKALKFFWSSTYASAINCEIRAVAMAKWK